jgi:hypothetical protein
MEMATFRSNMTRVLAVVLGLPVAYAGCSAREPVRESAPPFVKPQTKFDYSEHEPYAKPGENGISGQALLRQQGDSVVTCAGSRVLLLPATSYFREMFWHIIAEVAPNPQRETVSEFEKYDQEDSVRCTRQFLVFGNPSWYVVYIDASECDGGVLIAELTLSNRGTTPVLLTDKHLVGR